MNETFDNNALKIATYLEEGMSPLEETLFMDELSRDETLRRQYEEELLIRSLREESGQKVSPPATGIPKKK
jgi:hypothetical protein